MISSIRYKINSSSTSLLHFIIQAEAHQLEQLLAIFFVENPQAVNLAQEVLDHDQIVGNLNPHFQNPIAVEPVGKIMLCDFVGQQTEREKLWVQTVEKKQSVTEKLL